jgi:hypothetical protein
LAHQFSNVDPRFSHSGRLLDDEGAVPEVRQPTLGRGWDLFIGPNILKKILFYNNFITSLFWEMEGIFL